jgi:uncharacterized protein YndB with AHSA1/START domain
MSNRSPANAIHGHFTIERTYAHPRARVFAAWADPELKARWFGGGGEQTILERRLDFRVGGEEALSGRWDSGLVSRYRARYHDIVPDERIVSTYEMRLDDAFHSVSLATVELTTVAAGTQLRYTEQVAFLDGKDGTESRRHGSAWLFGRIDDALAGKAP